MFLKKWLLSVYTHYMKQQLANLFYDFRGVHLGSRYYSLANSNCFILGRFAVDPALTGCKARIHFDVRPSPSQGIMHTHS